MKTRAGRQLVAFVLGMGLSALGCASSEHLARPTKAPTSAAWREARRKLSAIRAEAQGKGPRTLRLSLALREPITGRLLEARGAVALSPPDALRMILLGPGGTTSLDLWARGEKFRVKIPAIDLLRRGDASTPRAEKRGLPVDFLRWWLLRPASGTLLWHEAEADGDRFYLRDGDAVIELFAARSGRLSARRSTRVAGPGQDKQARLEEEIVEADHLGCGVARYEQPLTKLTVTVTCEGEETSRAPSERAFVDPDELEQAP